MPDPVGPRITTCARGARNYVHAFGDFVKAVLTRCFWGLVASAGMAGAYLVFRTMWWGVQAVLKAVGA